MKAKSAYAIRRLQELGVSPRPPAKPAKKPRPRMWAARMIPLKANTMAQDYIKQQRRARPGESSWFDVRDAYLAGFTAGYHYEHDEAKRPAVRQGS